MTRLASPRWALPILVALCLIAALVVWFAPPEKTMGDGIRPVYVHVALIWTAMLGMLIMALIGVAVVATGRVAWIGWMQTVGWVSFGFFLASQLASVWAQLVNWNGIFWDEPRTQITLRVAVIFLVVLIANHWLPWPRLRGLSVAIPIALMLAALRFSPLILHPRDPISVSSSSPIQLTFVVLFGLCLAAAAQIVWLLRRRPISPMA